MGQSLVYQSSYRPTDSRNGVQTYSGLDIVSSDAQLQWWSPSVGGVLPVTAAALRHQLRLRVYTAPVEEKIFQ